MTIGMSATTVGFVWKGWSRAGGLLPLLLSCPNSNSWVTSRMGASRKPGICSSLEKEAWFVLRPHGATLIGMILRDGRQTRVWGIQRGAISRPMVRGLIPRLRLCLTQTVGRVSFSRNLTSYWSASVSPSASVSLVLPIVPRKSSIAASVLGGRQLRYGSAARLLKNWLDQGPAVVNEPFTDPSSGKEDLLVVQSVEVVQQLMQKSLRDSVREELY